jgi:hypothetical protein
MNISRLNITPNSNVLIIEDFFDQELLARVQQYFDNWQTDVDEWVAPTELHRGTRWQCMGTNPVYQLMRDYFASEQVVQQLNRYLPGKKMYLSNFNIWLDRKGMGPLQPHVEQADGWLAQIFVTRVEHPYTGTTIYSADNKILIQLPYRNNFGWFFDKGCTVNHGREHDVPESIDRFIVMAWYGDSQVETLYGVKVCS